MREVWNRPREGPRATEARRISALKILREQMEAGCNKNRLLKGVLLIRVVPPKSFGPYAGIRGGFFIS